MCLAIPSKIVEINDLMAVVDVDGVKKEASLVLLEDPMVGEYVIVHAGFAIHRIDEDEAIESLKLLRKAASLEPNTSGHPHLCRLNNRRP